MTDADPRKIPESVSARGITDRASGIESARASRQWLCDAAEYVLKRRSGSDLYDGHLLVMGLASRAAGLHDAAVNALETDNPFATYTLLRSYAATPPLCSTPSTNRINSIRSSAWTNR